MSKTEFDWYRKEKPFLDIRKLDTKSNAQIQQELISIGRLF